MGRNIRPSRPFCCKAAELLLKCHSRRRENNQGLDFVMRHDAELLTLRGDALLPTWTLSVPFTSLTAPASMFATRVSWHRRWQRLQKP